MKISKFLSDNIKNRTSGGTHMFQRSKRDEFFYDPKKGMKKKLFSKFIFGTPGGWKFYDRNFMTQKRDENFFFQNLFLEHIRDENFMTERGSVTFFFELSYIWKPQYMRPMAL